jgi:predicted transcriptional regulator
MPRKVDAAYRILEALSVSREPLNLYQLEKVTGLKHATVHKTFKKLLTAKLVKPIKTSKFRTGLPSTFYAISWNGLILVLMELLKSENLNSETLKRIDEIAKAREDMSIIFKKWHVFEPVKKDITLSIHATVKGLYEYIKRVPEDFRPYFMQKETEICEDFEDSVLGIYLMQFCPPPQQTFKVNYEAIWRICKQDPELNKTIECFLNTREKEMRELLEGVEKAKEFWRSL